MSIRASYFLVSCAWVLPPTRAPPLPPILVNIGNTIILSTSYRNKTWNKISWPQLQPNAGH